MGSFLCCINILKNNFRPQCYFSTSKNVSVVYLLFDVLGGWEAVAVMGCVARLLIEALWLDMAALSTGFTSPHDNSRSAFLSERHYFSLLIF